MALKSTWLWQVAEDQLHHGWAIVDMAEGPSRFTMVHLALLSSSTWALNFVLVAQALGERAQAKVIPIQRISSECIAGQHLRGVVNESALNSAQLDPDSQTDSGALPSCRTGFFPDIGQEDSASGWLADAFSMQRAVRGMNGQGPPRYQLTTWTQPQARLPIRSSCLFGVLLHKAEEIPKTQRKHHACRMCRPKRGGPRDSEHPLAGPAQTGVQRVASRLSKQM